MTAGPGGPAIAPPFGPAPPEVIVGGVGDNEFVGATTSRARSSPVNGVLYVTAPDNVWALDAQDGHLLWRFFWRTRGGTHIGNRGAAMWRNYLFFVTPDDYLISLDARTGKERWHKEIANFNQQYFLTSAPVVVDNHVIVGTGNDLDSPGYLQSFDPETGDLQWTFYTVPMNPGDPGLETWKDLDAARNGGGHPWLPGAYDPETRLYIFGTGNPTPAYTSAPRGYGDNLFTCAIVAVHVDTGKMAWYFQTSPHDTHDWDSAQTPVLVDGEINGTPRKLVVTASRNGYYFTLDRLTGERLVTSQFSETVNWASGLNDKGQPVRIPEKDHHVGGALVSSNNGGATNWPPQAFSPDTGLLYVPTRRELRDVLPDRARSARRDGARRKGRSGRRRRRQLHHGHRLQDRQDGVAAPVPDGRRATGRGGPGLLATAGRLLFGGDVSGNFIAFDAGQRHVRCGTRASATCRTRHRPTWSTAGSTCSLPPATRSIRLRCTDELEGRSAS